MGFYVPARIVVGRWLRSRPHTLYRSPRGGTLPRARWRGRFSPAPVPGALGSRASGRGGFGRKLTVGALALLLIAASALFLLDALLWPALRVLAQAETQNMAVEAMYEAVRAQVAESDTEYRALFRVETNEQGQVTFLQPDTLAVNDLASRVAIAIQERLRKMGGRKVYIPLGRALGSRLLGGLGPRIGIAVHPVMLENVRIWDEFESAGINQTRHRIYLNVRLQVMMAIPFVQSEVPVEGDFPVAEAVIVGPVPSTYVGGAWLPLLPRVDLGGQAPSGSP